MSTARRAPLRATYLATAAVVALIATGCAIGAGGADDGAANEASEPAECPVTVGNGRTPKGASPSPERYSNSKLSVVLWSEGTVRVKETDANGSIDMKFPWWRVARGRLRISGHRLDASAAPLHAHVPRGYGPTGFQSTSIHFTTEGCWRVTGRVGKKAKLTFVTRVVKQSPAPPSS